MNLTGRPIYTKGQTSKHKSKPARDSAQGQSCTLRLDGCRNDTATVVLCHIRRGGGGGMGVKPPDFFAFYGCAHCHANEPKATDGDLLRALRETLVSMHQRGILVLK
jgi:hypothetical protein